MPSTEIASSYTAADSAATRPQPQARANQKLALTIPTLREADNIGGLLGHVRSVLDPMGMAYEILVVDDDSRDGTEEIVAAIAKKDPRVRLLVRKGERGLSGAVLYGWRQTEAAILGVMDADGQHPPELLPALIAAISAGNDLAIGSRYIAGGQLGKWNPVRKFLSATAIWATWPIQRAGIRAHDPMTGFFLIRRECIDRIAFQPSGFKLLLEILVRGRLRSVAEVPLAFGSRNRGTSKANFKVGWDYAKLLARLYWERYGFWHRG
ncbi:MAG: polyprenol monophosphomannose synthase [Terracidiphilus sp.]|jgi:dolichol-phosphate mannosyltransferase